MRGQGCLFPSLVVQCSTLLPEAWWFIQAWQNHVWNKNQVEETSKPQENHRKMVVYLCLMGFYEMYPLVIQHSYWKCWFVVVFPLNTVIFHRYVSLPKGISFLLHQAAPHALWSAFCAGRNPQWTKRSIHPAHSGLDNGSCPKTGQNWGPFHSVWCSWHTRPSDVTPTYVPLRFMKSVDDKVSFLSPVLESTWHEMSTNYPKQDYHWMLDINFTHHHQPVFWFSDQLADHGHWWVFQIHAKSTIYSSVTAGDLDNCGWLFIPKF